MPRRRKRPEGVAYSAAIRTRPKPLRPRIECGRCIAVFTTDKALARHTTQHHTGRGKGEYRCPYCWRRFSQRVALAKHRAELNHYDDDVAERETQEATA